ncbi:SH2 domain-containing adapter protein F isoform X2 [Sceloporus undulatus]|uniref:SH2 domain-containing adapter protein F isoform X2 n=1 Tax=Sceloporus undulatus TaxID=8520 RepID=UPI001C4C66EF|nr:SH2 domain-containing adapter protein F isoform X2 [Sceloporus undulatus]
MARWLRERLLFRGGGGGGGPQGKPSPPEPDYAEAEEGRPEEEGPEEQPDLVAAYRLQRERDFEDPYGPAAGAPEGGLLLLRHRHRHRRRLLLLLRAEAQASRPGGEKKERRKKEASSSSSSMLILEDYADPFDTRQEASTSPAAEQDRLKSEGYMEPYEAQRLLAEIQKKGSKDGLAAPKPLHLYDIPYEPSENGRELPPLSGVQCRYSWLPEDDERPPEEYDQPWEWKKERISRVFAVEIEGIKELPWPPPVGQLDSSAKHSEVEGSHIPPPNLQNTSTSLPDASGISDSLDASGKGAQMNQLPSCMEKSSSPCWSSMEHGLAFGERVNPTLPLESQAWYHGTLSRVDAERLLRLCREASYLVRNSESSHDAFSLSLKSNQGFLHMKLLQTEDNKFILGQHSPPFDNVPEIIHHYTSHKLPIQGAEHISLLYPVTTQPSNCLAAEQ